MRAYIDLLLPRARRHGRPRSRFDRTVSLDKVPEGYREMDERTALKVIVEP